MCFLPYHGGITETIRTPSKEQTGFMERTVSLAFTIVERRARAVARNGMKCMPVSVSRWCDLSFGKWWARKRKRDCTLAKGVCVCGFTAFF